MKDLPPALAEHLAGGVTTLARCWRIRRRDGVVLGFTDHDGDLTLDGEIYHADSGFTASALQSEAGLAVSNVELEGGLRSAAITEADLAAGLYDDAECLLYLVNWQDPEQRLLLRRGHIGEVTREQGRYRAELRGLAHRLDQAAGRLFERRCAWTLGDGRCGVDLEGTAYRRMATVVALEGRQSLWADGIGDVPDGMFAHGRLIATSGPNAGLGSEIAEHQGSRLRLLLPLPRDISAGDRVEVIAGCDRQFETCRVRFGNAVNFGGFPHMPGADFVLSYPNQGDGNDGSSLA